MNRTKIALTALAAVFAMGATAPAFAADKPAATTAAKTAPAKAKHHHHKKKTDASATTIAPKAK